MGARWVFLFLISLLFGIALSFTVELRFTVVFGVLIVSCVTGCFASRFIPSRRRNVLMFISVLIIGCVLGSVRGVMARESRDAVRASIPVQGAYVVRVVSDPIIGDRTQTFRASIREVGDEPANGRKDRARILVRAPYYPRVRYGSTLIIGGELKPPEPFETESGRLFPYDMFLAKDFVFYTMSPRSIAIVSERGLQLNPTTIVGVLLSIKHSFVDVLNRVVGQPSSALLAGMTIGNESGLGAHREDAFRRVGIVHIVVLSGYNVTLVAESMTKLIASFASRTISLAGGLFGIVLFALMTGGAATVVRASVMASIALIGKLLYRTTDAGRSLFVAGVLMVFHNPYILLYDPSFQLSFLATVGIIYVAPRIEGWFVRRVEVRAPILGSMFRIGWFRELVAGTIGTQVVVLPLLVFMSSEVSIISLIANILIVPITPVLMSLAGLTVTVSWIINAVEWMVRCVAAFLITSSAPLFVSMLAGFESFVRILLSPFSLFSNLAAHYVFKVVDVLAALPFATVQVPPWTSGVLVTVYGVTLIMMYRSATKNRTSIQP